MAYDFSKLKNKVDDTKVWFKEGLSILRTGRVSPALLENIQVDSYGAKTPLKHVASISVEDARTLRVTPWDAGNLKGIEVALASADLGSQPIADEQSVRISMPALTEERRNSLIKIIGEKLEEAKISLRTERDETWKDIQAREKEGVVTEDEKFRLKDDMQKVVDTAIKDLEEISKRKEEELKI